MSELSALQPVADPDSAAFPQSSRSIPWVENVTIFTPTGEFLAAGYTHTINVYHNADSRNHLFPQSELFCLSSACLCMRPVGRGWLERRCPEASARRTLVSP